MDPQKVKDISILLGEKCASTTQNCSFNGKYLNIHLSPSEIATLTASDIEYDGEEQQIDLLTAFPDDFLVFFDQRDFIRRYKVKTLSEFHILILKFNETYLLKSKDEDLTNSQIIANYSAYKELLSYILEATDFISYSNSASQEFVLISEKGPVQIGYDPLEERFLLNNELPSVLERLKSSFRNIEFQGFFKDAVIETISRHEKKDRFYNMVLGLSILLDVAERDYQLYIRKFAFDKIKSKFKEERLKYFESIEKNIDSINKQVTTFPLTFSASIFASYQVKDKPFILVLILIVYSLYTFIAWKIINISKVNMENVNSDIISERDKIEQSYNVLYEEFKPDFEKIFIRVSHVNSLISTLRFIIITMLVLFTVFVVFQFLHPVITPQIVDPIKPKLL